MTPNEQFWWGWGASAATAAGTIFLGIVALWGDRLRRQCFPPKLHLTLFSREGEEARSGEERKPTRFYRLKVSNQRRWSVATRCQVFLLSVEVPAADGRYQVVWSTPVPIAWRFQQVNPIMRDIGPSADCNLCSVTKDQGLQLYPLVKPLFLETEYTQAVRLRLTLQVQSVEVDSDRVQVDIAWDGQWADGAQEMMQHLVVNQL